MLVKHPKKRKVTQTLSEALKDAFHFKIKFLNFNM